MASKVIRLPVYNMVITLGAEDPAGDCYLGGHITSDLNKSADRGNAFDHTIPAFDAIESVVLGHAVAGINVEMPAYIEGIETAVDAITNRLGE